MKNELELTPNDPKLSDGARKPSQTEPARSAVRCSALLGDVELLDGIELGKILNPPGTISSLLLPPVYLGKLHPNEILLYWLESLFCIPFVLLCSGMGFLAGRSISLSESIKLFHPSHWLVESKRFGRVGGLVGSVSLGNSNRQFDLRLLSPSKIIGGSLVWTQSRLSSYWNLLEIKIWPEKVLERIMREVA